MNTWFKKLKIGKFFFLTVLLVLFLLFIYDRIRNWVEIHNAGFTRSIFVIVLESGPDYQVRKMNFLFCLMIVIWLWHLTEFILLLYFITLTWNEEKHIFFRWNYPVENRFKDDADVPYFYFILATIKIQSECLICTLPFSYNFF